MGTRRIIGAALGAAFAFALASSPLANATEVEGYSFTNAAQEVTQLFWLAETASACGWAAPDEATKFWPIYDQYIQETIKINDARWTLIKDYEANYDKMSDQMAENYMKTSARVDQQLVALREKYVPIFEKVVSPKKTALWYQIDRRLDLVINLQLAGMIPVVDASK